MQRSLWFWPIVVAALSTAGLVFALVGDGAWDALSWLLLGVPVALAAWFSWRHEPARD